MVRRTLALALGAGLLLGACPAVAATPSGAIDTSSKASVRDAWNTRMAPNLDVESGWTGSTDDCTPGHPSDAAQQATLESVNFVRAMAGLDPVGFSGKLNRQAQAAALIMDANDALSHDPPSDWKCWTQTGHDAAGHSNIALTSGEMHAGQSVQLYMDDPGPGNHAAGHRRWVLNPYVDTMGNGLTAQANSLYVFGPTDDRNTNPAWVAWPTRGWFPGPLEPGGRWSLSSGDAAADFSHATVVVKRGTTTKTRLKVTRFTPEVGYGQPTLVFQVAGVRATGTYTVVVRDIRGGGPARHRYVVRLFTP
ncbi:hypothetical protein NLS1_27110 [Nocardioides sp. LS1]|nr:hypothetical protein NLS1_27110 [Nocardioides sp. LS1]